MGVFRRNLARTAYSQYSKTVEMEVTQEVACQLVRNEFYYHYNSGRLLTHICFEYHKGREPFKAYPTTVTLPPR